VTRSRVFLDKYAKKCVPILRWNTYARITGIAGGMIRYSCPEFYNPDISVSVMTRAVQC